MFQNSDGDCDLLSSLLQKGSMVSMGHQRYAGVQNLKNVDNLKCVDETVLKSKTKYCFRVLLLLKKTVQGTGSWDTPIVAM